MKESFASERRVNAARKACACRVCNGAIAVGRARVDVVGVVGGAFTTYSLHVTCRPEYRSTRNLLGWLLNGDVQPDLTRDGNPLW